ncbi:DUF1007 family protein [Ectothiorhodospira marina]|uniref:ABC-type uncharacterized transport system, substrate-binding protein n=1 Tax=Ectothiorhodospira marina TaxID=1396821 RepID=A0A1H7H3R0_9GAMM|nr:DUF1007 family protein [Ectothiorhodospira marina]SEK42755.1 ABC-type uncharacterized transport system, substrate-binding protein [Ectothiorhodospira marina]
MNSRPASPGDCPRPAHRLRQAVVGGLLLTLLWAAPAHSHPHAWIDLQVTAVFNADGHITQLRQAWLMDPFYSTFLLDDMAQDASGDTQEERLDSIARKIIENLDDYHHFTEIHHGDTAIQDARAEDPQLVQKQRRLELSFTLSFQHPLDPTDAPLKYAVFDPTYFIEILHAESGGVHLEGGSERCDMDLRIPRPDPALVARAAVLDYDQQGDPDMGKHFAERVTIECSR